MDTSTLKVLQKGYTLLTERIQNGWYFDHSVTAKHISTAKSMLLKILKGEEALDTFGEPFTFNNVPLVRHESRDLVMFEDIPTLRFTVEKILRERSRNNELDSYLVDPEVQYCYILKHGSYYADNSCGYVSRRDNAGIYTIEDGVSKAKSCEDLRIIPVDNAEHNKMTFETIKASFGRMIIDKGSSNVWHSVGELIGLLEKSYTKS